jgi:lysophospholipase L1-like esterase
LSARFLALGDSYTIGEGVDAADRWPQQLVGKLQADGFDVGDPEIVATTGWTTDELAAGIDAAAPAGPFEMVSLLIGVNNQYRGRPVIGYRREFAALLRRAVGFAGGDPARVFAVSIPDWGVTPFAQGRDREAIGREIDAFNAENLDEARAAGVAYVDVTAVSREAALDASLVAGDGLHPSGALYRLWAELALLPAKAALEA